VQREKKSIQEPYEMFEFLWNIHKQSTKEQLLKLVKNWPDYAQLEKLDQVELALEFCDRWAAMFLKQHPLPTKSSG
jgi:hypothetical protein